MSVLIVTAVDFEAAALDLGADVIVGGVGPAESAAATAAALAAGGYDLVISAGIAGGFAPLAAGEIAVAGEVVFADLGVVEDSGFRPLGLATTRYPVDPQLAVQFADVTGGRLGTILTVATMTGTARRADELLGAHPDAVAEAMEGAGVAAAAAQHGVRFAEVRAISNLVGLRDRDAWRVDDALAALASALAAAAQKWDA